MDEEEETQPFVEMVVRREDWEVVPRLLELGTALGKIVRIRDLARAEAANVTPFHCRNASGTFAYQFGVFALRNEHVGDAWRVECSEGVEGIYHRDLNVRFLFSNVDVACDDLRLPRPRSKKGSGVERACEGNLFGSLPYFARRPATEEIKTFYVLVDEKGAVELSRPVVSGETFSSFLERNYISLGGEDGGEILPLIDDEPLAEFDPLVARK